jgi:hypothetical protein
MKPFTFECKRAIQSRRGRPERTARARYRDVPRDAVSTNYLIEKTGV